MTDNQAFPNRLVLQGVPKIGFYSGGPLCPEDLPLPAVMHALADYLDDPDFGCNKCKNKHPNCMISCTYSFFTGITGAAFFLSWKEGWHDDNVAAFYLDADPAAMEKNAFKALGYSFELVMPKAGGSNQEHYFPRIVESLQRGLPVVSYGIIGPPEAGLITGYDEGGEVLIGWNFFQGSEPGLEFEPSGYYRKRNWANDAQSGLLIIGKKQPKPALKETFRSALEFGLKVNRTPMVHPEPDAPEEFQHRHNGLAAYTAWANQLLRAEDFPAGDEAALRQHYQVHDNVLGILAEARWYGSQFFLDMTEHVDVHVHRNAIEDVLHAAALYAGEHELMWYLWDLAGGIGNPEGYKHFADPAVREKMVKIILQAGEKDARAVEHLESALAKW